MQKRYGIVPINGNRTIDEINSELQDRIIKAIDSNII
jgi:hypothetical protein